MKIDILAFGAHPDDVELSCGGTIFKEIQNGKTVGIIDLTKGELGTRGTASMFVIKMRRWCILVNEEEQTLVPSKKIFIYG